MGDSEHRGSASDSAHDELVMSLVESALRTAPEQRYRRLADLCPDAAVQEEVRIRIHWEEKMGRFLLEPLISLPADKDQFEPKTLVADRFRIIRKVGYGGMGVVYEAVDEKLDRRVALKCAQPGHVDRLPPEARAAREVSHYNVCKVHDLHVVATPEGEMEFLSMEFIEGQTLTERIRREGALPRETAREAARQICAGLAQAHRQGVIHGDLKCSNIILAQTPEGGVRAVITDFGLAKMKYAEGSHRMSGRGGTLDYMAPELLLGGRATVASDLYALGVLFHMMLTGRSPERLGSRQRSPSAEAWNPDSQVSTVTVAAAFKSKDIVEADWRRKVDYLPAPWKKVVAGCLAAQPEKRFESAAEVAKALAPLGRNLTWTAVPAGVAIAALGYWQWMAQPAGPPVRLAVLPFSLDGGAVGTAAGIGSDVAERLASARRSFTVISPREAQANNVDSAEKAKTILGATHVLKARLRGSGTQIEVEASLVDLGSGRDIGQLTGIYATADTPMLAKAILATVTGAFHLRKQAPKESVSGAAYAPYVQGIELLQQDGNANAGKAIPYFERAIQLDPRSALPYAGLAEAQVQRFLRNDGSQWLDAAEASIAKAKSINPDSVKVLLASGIVEQQRGQYERANHNFTRATELDPANPDAWRRLAGVYQRTNRDNEAVATYERAIQAQPNDYHFYADLGTFYFYRNQFHQAEAQYRHVVALVPGMASAHMNLGLALTREDRLKEAEQSLAEALHLRKSPRLLMNLGGLYYQEEKYAEAAQFFEQSLEESRASGSPVISQYRDLGDAYRHLGRLKDASEAYRTGLAVGESDVTRNPRDAVARVRLALLSAFLGDPRRAEFEASQALAMEPENAAVMREAAITYEFLQQREKTLELLRNAPALLLEELSRQPDVRELQQDPRFQELVRKISALQQ